jgi:hypothetical protein
MELIVFRRNALMSSDYIINHTHQKDQSTQTSSDSNLMALNTVIIENLLDRYAVFFFFFFLPSNLFLLRTLDYMIQHAMDEFVDKIIFVCDTMISDFLKQELDVSFMNQVTCSSG